ncbi:MAG: anthranilate phosphoribosyltransferase [Planctomycetota bacterium]|jgi:anthranilate phosphoribosyltransferase
MNLLEAFQYVHAGGELTREQSREVFTAALTEQPDTAQLAGFLVALANRRESMPEVLGAAEALRSQARPFEHSFEDAIDTCGTGGDGLGSFNLSTASALVAASAGARVIKHGNRSVSSSCGSADLLEACGIVLELSPEAARTVLEDVGITYLHAPYYHPSMAFAGPVRRSLGVRTIFNLLGPLANPGRVRRQVLGIADSSRMDDYAQILEHLGHARALVVHGAGGADELTLEPGNQTQSVGDMPAFGLEPQSLGLERAPVSALAGGDAQANLGLLHKLLDGDGGPLRDALLYNTAAALVVAGVAADALEGVRRAAEAIDSGLAKARLAQWVALTQAVTQ